MQASSFIIRALQPKDESCGAAMTQFIIGIMDSVRASSTITSLSPGWRSISSRCFPSWRGSALRMPGGARSTPARASAHFGGQGIMERRRTPWAIQVSASGHPALGRACSWIFWMIVRTNARSWRWYEPNHCPSHRSRSAPSGSVFRAGQWHRRTITRGEKISGCGR